MKTTKSEQWLVNSTEAEVRGCFIVSSLPGVCFGSEDSEDIMSELRIYNMNNRNPTELTEMKTMYWKNEQRQFSKVSNKL